MLEIETDTIQCCIFLLYIILFLNFYHKKGGANANVKQCKVNEKLLHLFFVCFGFIYFCLAIYNFLIIKESSRGRKEGRKVEKIEKSIKFWP